MSDRHFMDHEEPGGAVLDPVHWIRNSVVPARRKIADELRSTNVGAGIDPASVETATALWRGSPQYPGQANSRFFASALVLRSAGVSLSDIENRLNGDVDNGRTDDFSASTAVLSRLHHTSARVYDFQKGQQCRQSRHISRGTPARPPKVSLRGALRSSK